MLRGLEVELVPAWQSLLQAEATSGPEHLDVQVGEVPPVPGPESAPVRFDLQHSEAPRTGDGEGQKSAAHGAGDTGADRPTSTTRARQANAFSNAADLLERNRRRLRDRRQRRQSFHQLGQRTLPLESVAPRPTEQQRAVGRGHRAGSRSGLHAWMETNSSFRRRHPQEYNGAGTTTPTAPTATPSTSTTLSAGKR